MTITIDDKIIINYKEQYVTYPRSLLGVYNSFTVLAKFKLVSGYVYGDNQLMSVFGPTSDDQEFSFGINDKYPTFMVNSTSNGLFPIVANATTLVGDTDYVLAATYNSATPTMNLYLNGSLLSVVSTGILGSQIQQGDGLIRVARRLTHYSNFVGTIYDLRFYKKVLTEDQIANYTDWPLYNGGLVFFIGGNALKDPISGEILSIDFVDIPETRREEIRRLVLKHKPMHSWGVSLINYS